ncbi:MAG: adenylate/guanylate cyclase domain-containing protein [Bdellovibrionota bacterium]
MSKKKEEAQAALDVGENASTRTIRVSFRRKARALQDGLSETPRSQKSFEELNEAFKTLMSGRQAGEALGSRRVTVLSSDVAEYSRMMAQDEKDTLGFFSFCKDAFEEIVATYQGRVFNTAGDAILAEFPNVINAVECAVEIQRELRAMNLGRPEDRRIQFRIGLNFGDVFDHGTDLLGDTVNVAARIQSAAKSGGICLSHAVYELLGATGHAVHFLGEKTFKNIPQPIRTYALSGDGASAKPPLPNVESTPRKAIAKKKVPAVETADSGSPLRMAGVVALIAVSLVAGWKLFTPKPTPKPIPLAAPAAPKTPEIAAAPLPETKAPESVAAVENPLSASSPATPVDEKIQKEAEGGDFNSNYRKGTEYLKNEKFSEAALFFQMSAQKGHMGAQYELGMLYFAGRGVNKDSEASIYWLLHSALNGNAFATRFLTQHESDFHDFITPIVNQTKIDANRRPAETANLRRQAETFLQGIHDTLHDKGLPVLPGTW